jgi:2-polyprenyl-3-methyl-5-hydroxy-6-metoxy-1,4-benzoquinol methylase
MRTLNLACGQIDKWGTDRLDREDYGQEGITIFDLNLQKPLPYGNDIFDEIRFWHTIQHLQYPQETLRECYRILKLGGILDITTINPASIYWVLRPMKERSVRGKQYHNNGKVLSIFNTEMLTERLTLEGFKVLDVEYWGRLNSSIKIRCRK